MESKTELQIGKWGNSLGIRLPKYISDTLNLHLKDRINCSIKEGKVILEPINRPKYTLAELLSQEIEKSDEVNWGKPEGDEIW